MKGITFVEHIPCLFENFKLPDILKLLGKVLKTSQNSAFYHSADNFEQKKNRIGRKHTSISP